MSSNNYKSFSNYLNGAPVVFSTAGPTQPLSQSATPYSFGASGFPSQNVSRLSYSTLSGKAYKQNTLFSAPYSARACSGGG